MNHVPHTGFIVSLMCVQRLLYKMHDCARAYQILHFEHILHMLY